MQINPACIGGQQTAAVGGFTVSVEGGLKLPQGLSQMLFRLVGRVVTPKQSCQDLAWMWVIAVEQKIAKQLLYLTSIEAGHKSPLALKGKLSE
jgi:hypothetical protein